MQRLMLLVAGTPLAFLAASMRQLASDLLNAFKIILTLVYDVILLSLATGLDARPAASPVFAPLMRSGISSRPAQLVRGSSKPIKGLH
jgi:hypothetical protein